MEQTANLGLKKPAETEFYNIADFNYNFDKIDEAIMQAKGTATLQDVTIAASSWTQSGDRFVTTIDTQDTDVSAGNVYFSPASLPAAIAAGIMPVTTCTAGVVKLYAAAIPESDLAATLETKKGGKRIMNGITNVSTASGGGGGASSYPTLKAGTLTAAGEVTFSFAEIDTIANDCTDDLTVTFYDADGISAGSFTLKEGESLNDMHFTGSKLAFAGDTVNCRYLLLG